MKVQRGHCKSLLFGRAVGGRRALLRLCKLQLRLCQRRRRTPRPLPHLAVRPRIRSRCFCHLVVVRSDLPVPFLHQRIHAVPAVVVRTPRLPFYLPNSDTVASKPQAGSTFFQQRELTCASALPCRKACFCCREMLYAVDSDAAATLLWCAATWRFSSSWCDTIRSEPS